MKAMSKGFFKRGGLVFLLILFSGQTLYAATKHHRVVWDADPSSQAIIAFSPDGTSTLPEIKYGVTTDEGSWSTLSALDQQTFDTDLVSYFGRLTSLSADSPVYYRVCDQDGCGQLFWFKTAPGTGNNTPFVVVAGGDTIDDLLRGYPTLKREDIAAVLAYGARLATERILPVVETS